MFLIREFLNGTRTASSFKTEYMRLWRACRDAGELSALNAVTANAFDRVFTAADSYCEDVELRDANDLDESRLVNEVAAIFSDIEQCI